MTNVAHKQEFDFDETQLTAIGECCDTSKRIVAVTGQAGTGKTTILQNVYDNLTARGFKVVLCAPTGKAAKRITEATSIPASTIHRLLEYPFPGERDPKTGKALSTSDPKRDRQYPLEYNVVLCDEYAMVSVEIHRNLLNALPRGGAIRMFGDANQLQPIESIPSLKRKPSMFLEMLEEWNGITLESIHRQANDSDIITNGNRIIAGNMPKRTDDFNLIITKKPVHAVHDFIMDNLHNEIDFGSITNQIITATNIGWVGTMALNASIQQLLQPQNKLHFDIDRHKWVEEPTMRMYVGDKVIFTINNYALEIFNGETGIIKKLEDDGSILIDFGDRESSVPMELEVENKKGTFFINPQKNLDLAYVITTHKSQGSEYQRVCYVMNKSRQWMLNRKNLYTAISRAREHVTIITDSNALARSLAVKGDK